MSKPTALVRVEAWHPELPLDPAIDVAGVAVDAHDNVVCLNRYPSEIVVLDSFGRLLRRHRLAELSERPHAITVGRDGLTYVTDEFDHTVRIVSRDGEIVRTLGKSGRPSETGFDNATEYSSERLGSILPGGAPFNGPTDVAIGPDGSLYVTDGYGNARVHHFSAAGTLIRSWGAPGTSTGEFNLPHSAIVDSLQRVLVCDRENDRVEVFTLDGEHLDSWTDVRRPTGIVENQRGHLFVTELGHAAGRFSYTHGVVSTPFRSRISVLDLRGEVLGQFENDGVEQILAPHAITIDSTGDLYIGEVTRTMGAILSDEPNGKYPPSVRKLRPRYSS